MADINDFSRRDLMKIAGTAAAAVNTVQAAPAILTVKAATDQVKFGVIGIGGRGQYLLKHLSPTERNRLTNENPRII